MTAPRGKPRSRQVAYLLATRKLESVGEVLLERRDPEASLMAGMLELPALPLDAVEGREPVLRVRHSITNTNYYVEIFAPRGAEDQALKAAVPAAEDVLCWEPLNRLRDLPLTGLARKVLMRLDLMSGHGLQSPEAARRQQASADES